jgi:hypothetical protein
MARIDEMAGVGIDVTQAAAINTGSKNLAVTAAGSSSQADSTVLTAAVNLVTTGGANTGVKPADTIPVDSSIQIYNAVGNTILVYPPSGGEINGLGANAAASLAQDKGMTLTRLSATAWGATFA